MKMTVYFTKNNDLIFFHFNTKKLNMFNFLHINPYRPIPGQIEKN